MAGGETHVAVPELAADVAELDSRREKVGCIRVPQVFQRTMADARSVQDATPLDSYLGRRRDLLRARVSEGSRAWAMTTPLGPPPHKALQPPGSGIA